ncbi:hypothetical protein ACFWD7_38790 [Streptomyces mirabilis]|uniref:hypothetical protein n=1 Tax=Streptomyces mirabilis TaxID=68239 RepID=UPI0021C1FE26|nr:hypothetical protein [Streptomyces mirabilis]MCT9108123.1 hypothetical protein [Streptomyces mirabilis]
MQCIEIGRPDRTASEYQSHAFVHAEIMERFMNADVIRQLSTGAAKRGCQNCDS